MQKQAVNLDTSPDNGKSKGPVAASAGSEGALMKESMRAGGGGDTQLSQSNGASTIRRLSGAESQDFEFNKQLAGDIINSPYYTNVNEQQLPLQAGVLASADELFYKGQLLPLHYNNNNALYWSPHLQYSTQSCTPTSIAATINSPSDFSESLSPHITRDQDLRFSSSCRMDNINLGLDSSLFDFRCSSFRSHSSKHMSSYYCNYYANYGSNCSNLCDSSSTPTASTINSSSSRDSNSSSQDSCSYPDNNKENHQCCQSHAVNNLPLDGSKRKQGIIMQSWRHLLNGLKRSSSNDHQVHNSSQYIQYHGGLKSSVSADNKISLVAKQGSSSLACGCKGQNRRACNMINEKPRSSQIKGPAEKEGIKKKLCADNQSPTCEIKRGRANGAASNHNKSSKWQGYTRRIKPISIIKARLVGNYGQDLSKGAGQSAARSVEEEKEERGSWNKRITRKPLQPSLYDSSTSASKASPSANLQQVSFRFHAVSSSCPASVRSSPNHSGLLSPPSCTMSTMQELHSAVQGAIAHCKQSNTAHLIAHTPPAS